MRFDLILTFLYLTIHKPAYSRHMSIEIFVSQKLTSMNFRTTLVIFTELFFSFLGDVVVLQVVQVIENILVYHGSYN
jgi:hypothetical protein